MTEGAAEDIVDSDGQDERGTSHSKGKVIGVIDAGTKILLGPLHDTNGCRRCKEGTDVDCHVEDGEAGVTP